MIVESEVHRRNWMSPSTPNLRTFLNELDASSPHDGVVTYWYMDAGIHSMEPNQLDKTRFQIENGQ